MLLWMCPSWAIIGRDERAFEMNSSNSSGHLRQFPDSSGNRCQTMFQNLMAIRRASRQESRHAELILRQRHLSDFFDRQLPVVELNPAKAVDLQIDEARR